MATIKYLATEAKVTFTIIQRYALQAYEIGQSARIDDILIGNGTDMQILLPYVGPMDLDLFGFISTAIITSIGGWWRIYRYGKAPRNTKSSTQSPRDSNSGDYLPIAKAKQWKPSKDKGLYEFMETAQRQRQLLRKVPDPEASRAQRMKELKKKDNPSGPLQLSESLLKQKRSGLVKTNRSL